MNRIVVNKDKYMGYLMISSLISFVAGLICKYVFNYFFYYYALCLSFVIFMILFHIFNLFSNRYNSSWRIETLRKKLEEDREMGRISEDVYLYGKKVLEFLFFNRENPVFSRQLRDFYIRRMD